VALVVAVGCSGNSAPKAGTTTSAPPQGEACPSVHGVGFAAIDYVDFIDAFGQQYLARVADKPIAVSRSDLGQVVLRSRCSLSALNDRTHKTPDEERDGDTGFLAPGTPIYAINGWSPQCRLAAQSPSGLMAYLALRADAKVATPRPCALHH
jgi:hypothetical protein